MGLSHFPLERETHACQPIVKAGSAIGNLSSMRDFLTNFNGLVTFKLD